MAAVALGAQREEGDKGEVGEVAAAGLPRRLLLQRARRRARAPDAGHLRVAGLLSKRRGLAAGTHLITCAPTDDGRP